ncbi:MAG: NUDIX domain-containing protein [Pseudohongiellaceae bacterium]
MPDIFKPGKDDFRVISTQARHEGFVRVESVRLTHRLFAGGWSAELQRELIIRKPAAGVLLVDYRRDEVVLIRQFRVGLIRSAENPWLLELVAGLTETGESSDGVIKREAVEEADCAIEKLIPIGEYYSSPGASNEKVSLYCGLTDSANAGGIHGLDSEHEDIQVVVMSVDAALELLQTGCINNAMTLIALQWLQLNRARLAENRTTDPV